MTQTTTPKRAVGDVDRISWTDRKGVHTARVSNAGRLNEVMPTKRARKTPKYKGQVSFQGHYWFTGVGAMVWHESMAEYSWLMMFDYMRSIRAISSQPFVIGFADGTSHVPDYLMRDSFGHSAVVDVHPEALTTERDIQAFSATRRVCDRLGWEYIVVDQMPDVTAWNLEMISRYRHPMFDPDTATREQILRLASSSGRFGELRQKLVTDKPGELVPALMHLLWSRDLLVNLEQPFTEHSTIVIA